MASIGAVGQHFIKFPWASGVKGTFGAMNTGEGIIGFIALLIACGPLELLWREDPEKEPGNFGNPFMGILFSLGGACCGVFQPATALYSDPLAQPVSSCFFFFAFRLPAHSSSPPFAPSNRYTHVHRC